MSQSSNPSGPSTAVLRAAVAVVLVLTLAAVGLLVMRAMADLNRSDPVVPAPAAFAPAVLALAAGVGLAAVVEGVARMAGRPSGSGAAPAGGEGLTVVLGELRRAVAALAPPPAPPAVEPPTTEVAPAEPAPADPAPAELPPAEPVADPYLAHFERMVHLLEEIKELSTLDDAGRQARGQQAKERRKAGRLEEADLLAHRQQWEQADALLTLLESLHPGDPDVLARRVELDDARTAHRQAEWAQLVRHVEDLMALSRYDEAAAAVAAFRESHPAHTDAAGLAAQVAADRDAHVEAGVTALFNEIKTAVDARQWRMALDGVQRCLHKYPDHPRSERIRQQVRTIQKNAEIEERHELEDRIKELARTGRFGEAADLCESLLERFPDSPQAPSLTKLLPRLRERSAMAEAAAE